MKWNEKKERKGETMTTERKKKFRDHKRKKERKKQK